MKLNRGSLSSGDILDTAATASQAWAKWDSTNNHWATLLDSTGNWSAFKQDDDGGGVTGSSPTYTYDAGWELSQTRKHNVANEVDDNTTHGDTTDPTALTNWKVLRPESGPPSAWSYSETWLGNMPMG